jgi:hypothetical protein
MVRGSRGGERGACQDPETQELHASSLSHAAARIQARHARELHEALKEKLIVRIVDRATEELSRESSRTAKASRSRPS